MLLCLINKKYFPLTAFFSFVVGIVFMSCNKEVKSTVNLVYDNETTPTMLTHNDTMLVSDSGLIRYKVIAETSEIFDRAKDPHWRYPDGFYLEQFDSVLNIVATVKADTVWNYTQRKLWKFKGNVFIHNRKDETFSGDELYWDQRKQKVYSNLPVIVNRPGQMTLRGTGFEANQQMTNYDFMNVGEMASGKTLIYVNEDAENDEEKQE
ncbi:MAG: LPS export ABC transporter periplasmic protein LptC [Prevotella sp.]|jgi:LPS export ABC transporter protein LptC|nr:LPS export ABC transporter periplasmic protein LptC [Prevotella sp.]